MSQIIRSRPKGISNTMLKGVITKNGDMHGRTHIKKEFVPNLDVLSRLAEAFLGSSLLKKTHIHFASRISWTSFDRYLVWLMNRNYVEHITDDGQEKYQLTDRGRQMFSIALRFKDSINSKASVHEPNLILQ